MHATIDTPDPRAAAQDRRNLEHLLSFLERRGASAEVIALAMQRTGVAPEVARLLARCRATPPGPSTPATVAQSPAPLADPASRDAASVDAASLVVAAPAERSDARQARAAKRALRGVARAGVLWLGCFGVGLLGGLAIGYEAGLGQGFDAGLDQLAAALQGH